MKTALALLLALAALSLGTAALAQAQTWKLVSNRMVDGRWAPGACLIPHTSSAVIAGGYSYAKRACVASIDEYDEAAGTFRHCHARMAYPRDFVEANPLPDGTILLSGGFNDVWGSMDIAEIYDPATDVCRLARGRMNQRRELFQAVNLRDGTVLLMGGLDMWARGTVASAETYDPATEEFTPTASAMAQDRFGQAACVLADGRVLVVGGTHWDMTAHETRVLRSAEIYDPETRSFHLTAGNLQTARDRPTATLLPNGNVLIFGGQGANGAPVTTAELFDPATQLFSTIASGPLGPRMAHCAALAPGTDDVCIAGGWDASIKATTPTALLYQADTGRFETLPDLPFAAHDEAIIAFPDGTVLVAGGKSVEDNRSASVDEGATISLGPSR